MGDCQKLDPRGTGVAGDCFSFPLLSSLHPGNDQAYLTTVVNGPNSASTATIFAQAGEMAFLQKQNRPTLLHTEGRPAGGSSSAEQTPDPASTLY